MDEFSVIEHFFKSIISNRSHLVEQSIGDDAAVLQCPIDSELLISTDTMVEGVHFLSDWPPSAVAYKLLATNVSDIAAMGGLPIWCSLALTLPSLNEKWLSDFSKGLNGALKKFNMDLIGGDLTKGPLTLTVTIHGQVKKGKAIKRCGARKGDIIYLTGSLGAPTYAVSQLNQMPYSSSLYQKLFYPEPRVNYAPLLQAFANSAIDISDGLSSDLSHILRASKKGACIVEEKLPLDSSLKTLIPLDKQTQLMLHSGDEYELCFTVSKEKKAAFEIQMQSNLLPYFEIGEITAGHQLTLTNMAGNMCLITPKGFKHF